MAVSIYHTATEYTSNAITLTRGSVSDITSVGVYHSADPSAVPAVGVFTTVTLADGTKTPTPDPLAIIGEIDVVALIGTKAGADLALAAGDWQRFVLIRTAAEDIIRKCDVLTIL